MMQQLRMEGAEEQLSPMIQPEQGSLWLMQQQPLQMATCKAIQDHRCFGLHHECVSNFVVDAICRLSEEGRSTILSDYEGSQRENTRHGYMTHIRKFQVGVTLVLVHPRQT